MPLRAYIASKQHYINGSIRLLRLLQLQLALQPLIFQHQLVFSFLEIRVQRNAVDGAHLHALWFIKMAYAFGAFMRIDFVDFCAHVNGRVRALRLAHVAVDAFIGNQ
jgi:hypothetical protein